MNILFLTNELNYTCGVTTHLLNLTNGLAKAEDVNISIICGGGNGMEKFKDTDADITVNKSFLHNHRSYINYTKALYFLIRYVKKNKIDIIHSHTHYAANLAYNASKFRSVKTVQTNHGLLEKKGRLPHFRADIIVAINEHIYDFITKEKIAGENNVSFIRGGISVPLTPAWKAKIRPKILAASRFVEEKGLDIFIKAVSLLPERDRNKAEFMISGEGKEEENLKKLNKEYGTNIKFLGRVEDMPSLFRETHVFVFTSSSETEGFPTVITEAAAYNNLIISSSCSGIEKVLISDFDGMIFKPGDAYDLMIKLKLVIDNYDTFKPMAEHFYNKVKKLYDLNTMIKKHIELYNSCLRDS
jgi:glycosyltransferase involved in cell wall biosynthesis